MTDRADELAREWWKRNLFLAQGSGAVVESIAEMLRDYGYEVRRMDCEELESCYSAGPRSRRPTQDDYLIEALVSNIQNLPLPGVKERDDE